MPLLNDPSNAVLLAILGAASMTNDSDRSTEHDPTLTLAGEPSRTAPPAVFYTFSPTVVQAGAADSKLIFSIENKPAWASFGRRHGTLYGVPQGTDAGTYRDIRITVTDGKLVANLQPFTIDVPAKSSRP